LRVLIFKDGVNVSSSAQDDKDKIILDKKGKYYLFFGADGPCKVSYNIGGKIFRTHHDELEKGLIAEGAWI
jgi:hypothetical protein